MKYMIEILEYLEYLSGLGLSEDRFGSITSILSQVSASAFILTYALCKSSQASLTQDRMIES